MDGFKYVIIDDLYPRICSLAEQHRELAGGSRVTSAGKASIGINQSGEIEVSAWGESISLNVKSKGAADAILIRRMLVGSY